MEQKNKRMVVLQVMLACAALGVFGHYYLRADIYHPTTAYLLALALGVLYWLHLRRSTLQKILPDATVSVPRWALIALSFVVIVLTEFGIAKYYDVFNSISVSFMHRVYYVALEIGSIYLFFFLTVYLLGDLLLARWLRQRDFSAFAARTAFGFFGVSLFGYALAGMGQLRIEWYIALLSALLVLRFNSLLHLFRFSLWERSNIRLRGREGYVQLVLFIVALLYFSFMLFNAYTRFHIDTDVLRAYQYVPRIYVETGSLVDFPYDYALHTAKGAEMLYVPLMFFAPYLVNYFMPFTLALIVFFLYQIVATFFDKRWAAFAVLAFLSTPLTQALTRTLKVDLFLVLITLCSFYFGLRWWNDRDKRDFIFSALLLGFSVTIKYSVLVSFPVIGFLLLLSRTDDTPIVQRLLSAVRTGIIYFLLVFAAASPWLIRNYALYGDPFHPFLRGRAYVVDAYSKDSGIEQSEFTSQWSRELRNSVYNKDNDAWYLVFVRSLGGLSPRSFGNIGPWYLALIILSIFAFRKYIAYYISLAVLLYVWYRWALYQVWYLFYLAPAFLLAGMYSLRQFAPRLKKFLIVIFVFFFFWGMKAQLKGVPYSYEFWIGKADINEDYFIEGSQLKQASNFINTTLLASDPQYKMYAINFYPSFFIRDAYRHLIVEPDHFSISYMYNVHKDVNDIKAFLQTKGIRYLFLSYPLYAKRYHEIDSYAAYPVVQQDIHMIDELLRSSRFIYSNDLFYVVDLSQPPRER